MYWTELYIVITLKKRFLHSHNTLQLYFKIRILYKTITINMLLESSFNIKKKSQLFVIRAYKQDEIQK